MDPTGPMLSRCVGSRCLPPRRVALRRRLGKDVAWRRSGHDTLLESLRTQTPDYEDTCMQARPTDSVTQY